MNSSYGSKIVEEAERQKFAQPITETRCLPVNSWVCLHSPWRWTSRDKLWRWALIAWRCILLSMLRVCSEEGWDSRVRKWLIGKWQKCMNERKVRYFPRTNTRQGMRICNRPSIEFAPLFSSAEGRISRSSLYILHLLAANYLPSTVEHLFHLLTGSDQCNFLYCYIAISSYNHSFLLLPTFRSFSNTRWSILRFVLVDTSFSWILSRSFL